MYLTGEKQQRLDAKLRLTLPADFRHQFGERVCLVPLKDAVWGFTPEGHQAWTASYFPNGFNPRDREQDTLQRTLMRRTVTVEIDSAGRVALSKLPKDKLERLGISRDVEVLGNRDHFEVWDLDHFNELNTEDDDELDNLMFD
ncbi:MAG: MraZ family transcriptional regulator [Coriobacteriaceae bacterium]|uniref:division/cell wall cluster transcriptional repressor MraZ n=1 Tax=Atopobium sp. oral taxon 416 TaxID=712157 RepID=UPI000FF4141F|nr:MraZ family transcriptional regulator [Atopobium sp. oral taxon 416]QUC04603.1 MraZ family transcriptional regulator [Atopobium sp. oral taxon 416]RRF99933.1 MAG: MraZ family transcriptional regulator [Coriobacteriaceae bacterium]